MPRNLAFSLYDGEQYFLQIDSHTCFEPGWDDTLRAQHTQLLARAAKPIISTYPYRFDMVDGGFIFCAGLLWRRTKPGGAGLHPGLGYFSPHLHAALPLVQAGQHALCN